MIDFRCDHCTRSLRVQEDLAGKRVRCPNCQQVLSVPAAGPGLPTTPPPGTTEEARAEGQLTQDLPAIPPGPARAPTAGAGEPTTPVGEGLLGGASLPGYEILGPLGRGAMGLVYKARQTELRRLVALKVVLTSFRVSPEEHRRFLKGARAAAQLQHPNVVQTYEVNEHDAPGGKVPFLSMEYVEGGDLAQHLAGARPQPLPGWEPAAPLPGQPLQTEAARARLLPSRRVAAELVEALARAIHFAHERGVIHRDMKPANVLLTSDGVPKVTDFGLAKQLEASTHATQTGTVFGTPAYMAPEQAAGETAKVGPHTDVYALGAMLYELLTGWTPFGGPPHVVIYNVLHRSPRRPRALNPAVPRDLERICLRCLHKNPKKRYPTAQALAEDLRRHLDPPRAAGPEGGSGGLLSWARRRPVAAGLAALPLLVLLAGVLLGVWAALTLPGEADRLRADLARSRRERQDLGQQQETLQAQLAGEKQARARQLTANGWRDFAEDPTSAFPWFAEALAVAEGDADAEAPARLRLGALRRRYPLERAWFDVQDYRFSPDGKQVVLAGTDGTARVRDLASGEMVASVKHASPDPGPGPPLFLLAEFSGDGKRLVTAGSDRTAQVWALATGKRLSTLSHGRGVSHAAFSADSSQVVTVDDANALTLWDARSGAKVEERPSIGGPGDRLLEVSPDGRLAVVGKGFAGKQDSAPVKKDSARNHPPGPGLGTGETVLVSALQEEAPPPADGGPVPGPESFFEIAIHSLTKPGDKPATPSFGYPIHRVVFSADGTRLLTLGTMRRGGTVKAILQVWDTKTGKLAGKNIEPLASAVQCLGLSPDGQRAAVGHADGSVLVWDVKTGEYLAPLLEHRARPSGGPGSAPAPAFLGQLCFSPDGRRLLTVCSVPAGGVIVEMPAAVPEPPQAPKPKVQEPQGKDSCGGTAREEPNVGPGPGEAPRPARAPAPAEIDGDTVQVWDVASGTLLTPPLPHGQTMPHGHLARGNLPHGNSVWSACFTPDGRQVFTFAGPSPGAGAARLWDTGKGELLTRPLAGSAGGLVALSAAGKHLIEDREDGRRMWELATGAQVPAPPRGEVIKGVHQERVPVMVEESYTVMVSVLKDGRRMVVPEERRRTAMRWVVRQRTIRGDAETLKAVRKRSARPPVVGANLQAQENFVGPVIAFSPDARLACVSWATPEGGPSMRVWDVQKDQPVTPPLSLPGVVAQAAFSKSGEFLAASGYSGLGSVTFRVWELSTGQPITPALPHPYGIADLLFSPDDHHLILVPFERSVSPAPRIQVWDLAPDAGEVAEHTRWARVAAGRRLDEVGRLEPLSSREQHAEWEMLRFLRAPDARPDQHRARLEACLAAGLWEPAGKHLEKVLQAEPKDGTLLAYRGDLLAEERRWGDAVGAYRKALEVKADLPARVWHKLAVAQLAGGDRDGYRQTCRDMRKRFADDEDSSAGDGVLWTCALSPDAVTDWQPLVDEARARARGGDPRFSATLGAVLYRAGQSAEALRHLEAAPKAPPAKQPPAEVGEPLSGFRKTANDLFLALALKSQNREAEAWDARYRASFSQSWGFSLSPGSPPAVPWEQREGLRLLFDEVIRALGSTPPPEGRAPQSEKKGRAERPGEHRRAHSTALAAFRSSSVVWRTR